MAKPVLKNKKEIVIPDGTESIVVSFRTIKRKGGIKNARKVVVPRAAAQAVIRLKKNRPATQTKSATKRAVLSKAEFLARMAEGKRKAAEKKGAPAPVAHE
ncbi:MAG: hypothetical protein LBF90_03325 [Prevotellaceae bacterium]|jgi:hypothetical protein|nr:hypothetical protein [Prevotellaceae bacterium]